MDIPQGSTSACPGGLLPAELSRRAGPARCLPFLPAVCRSCQVHARRAYVIASPARSRRSRSGHARAGVADPKRGGQDRSGDRLERSWHHPLDERPPGGRVARPAAPVVTNGRGVATWHDARPRPICPVLALASAHGRPSAIPLGSARSRHPTSARPRVPRVGPWPPIGDPLSPPRRVPTPARSGTPAILRLRTNGAIAQLEERLNGIQKVRGSNPRSSTSPLTAKRPSDELRGSSMSGERRAARDSVAGDWRDASRYAVPFRDSPDVGRPTGSGTVWA